MNSLIPLPDLPLEGMPEPDPGWITELSAELAADTLGFLITTAAELADHLPNNPGPDPQVEFLRGLLEVASELVDAVTQNAEVQPPITFPTDLTRQAADHLTHAAAALTADTTHLADQRFVAAAALLSRSLEQTADDLRADVALALAGVTGEQR